MSKSLRTIQKTIKVAKVLSMVVFVCCIVGAVGSLFGAIILYGFPYQKFEVDGTTLDKIIELESGESIDSVGALCIFAAIICAGEAISTKIRHSYYCKELLDGTPFTFEGAALLKSVAIKSFIVSVASIVAAQTTYTVMRLLNPAIQRTDLTTTISIGWCLFLLFLSVVFKYGAEQQQIK